MTATATPSPQLSWSGTLIEAAQVRTTCVDGAHAVPVLCMNIKLDKSLRNYLHVEQPFGVDQFKQAEAAAARLKKGTHVTVDFPPIDLCFTARNASKVTLTPEATELF